MYLPKFVGAESFLKGLVEDKLLEIDAKIDC